jgi:hypothetical protein
VAPWAAGSMRDEVTHLPRSASDTRRRLGRKQSSPPARRRSIAGSGHARADPGSQSEQRKSPAWQASLPHPTCWQSPSLRARDLMDAGREPLFPCSLRAERRPGQRSTNAVCRLDKRATPFLCPGTPEADVGRTDHFDPALQEMPTPTRIRILLSANG